MLPPYLPAVLGQNVGGVNAVETTWSRSNIASRLLFCRPCSSVSLRLLAGGRLIIQRVKAVVAQSDCGWSPHHCQTNEMWWWGAKGSEPPISLPFFLHTFFQKAHMEEHGAQRSPLPLLLDLVNIRFFQVLLGLISLSNSLLNYLLLPAKTLYKCYFPNSDLTFFFFLFHHPSCPAHICAFRSFGCWLINDGIPNCLWRRSGMAPSRCWFRGWSALRRLRLSFH